MTEDLVGLDLLFYSISTLFGSVNDGLKFKTIKFSISIFFVYKRLNVKTVLFQTIPFSKISDSCISNSSF